MHVPRGAVHVEGAMAQRSPLVVATHRLIDKQKNVSELLPATEDHLHSLECLENDFEASLQSAKDHVETQCAVLTEAVNRRKAQLIGALDEAASHFKESVSLYKRKTSDIIKKAENALESTNNLKEQEQGPFFRGYPSTSQLLEESFMDMLLLADSQSVDDVSEYTALLSDMKLDISGQLKSLQELDIPVGLQFPTKCISTTFPQVGEKDSPETSSELSEPPASPKKQLDKISPEKSPEPMEHAVSVTAFSLPKNCLTDSSCEVVSPESLPDSYGDESSPQPDEKDNTEVFLKPNTNSILESSDAPKTSNTETSATTESCDKELPEGTDPKDEIASLNTSNNQDLLPEFQSKCCHSEPMEQNTNCDDSSENPECGVMQSAKEEVVAEQQQEENTDGLSDVSHHISLPLVEDVKGRSNPARIEYLNAPPGSQLTVLVTQVTSPSSFSAQPYGPELIQLMEEMGDYYYGLAEEGNSGGLLTPPCVGDFCCAQFTEDDCWYRAKVEAVQQLFTTTEGTSVVASSHTFVQVNYVDYGNHEQLPLSSLRPLEARFCHLPCQGLICSLSDVQPVIREGRSVPQSTWPPEYCNWFAKLLLGKSVTLTILQCGRWNNLAVDIYLPSDVLLSAESLANFPVPVESVTKLSSYRHLVTPNSLASFMVSTGIARMSCPLMPSLLQMPLPLPFLNVPLATFACAAFTAPALDSVPPPSDVLITPAATSLFQLKSDNVETLKSAPAAQKCITNCPEPTDQGEIQETMHPCENDHCDSVLSNPEVTTTQSSSQMQQETTVKVSNDLNVDSDSVPQLDSHKSSTCACDTLSDLAPLSLQLGSCNDFTILMSHIVSPSKFFVHLVEEKSASEMVSLTKEMNDHYSQPSNCVPLVPEQLIVGTLCCLQSPDDDQWCRGLIISVKTSADASVKEVNVFFLDYGDSIQIRIRPDMLMELDKKFHQLPAQCVCCALSDIQPPCPSGTKMKQSPTVNASEHNTSQRECSPPLAVNDHSTTDKSITNSPAKCCKHNAVSAVQGWELGRSYEEHLTSDGQQWSAETTKILELLTNGKPLVAVVEVGDSEPSLLTLNSLDVVRVNLYDTTGEADIHINRELVETRLAEYTSGHAPKEANSTSPVSGQSPQSPGTQQQLQKWNPMELDFLAERNSYKIDDEDTVSALHGYRSTGRVCRYFTSREGCFLGSECPYLHLQEGVSDMQLEETFARTTGDLLLPDVRDWVVVIVTAMVSATKFFVQLPLGTVSPFSTGSVTEDSEADLCLDLDVLIEEMKSYYSHQVFDDRDVLHPHTGEIVAVRYPADQQWYRGRVIHCDGSSVQIYYVDYGNIDWVPETELRLMKPEFMNLPFQAVECYLAGVLMSSGSTPDVSKEEEAEGEFERLVTDKMLAAQVMWKNCSNAMGLLLYDTGSLNGDAGVSIGEVLINKGYFLPCESTPLPHEKSDIMTVTLPG